MQKQYIADSFAQALGHDIMQYIQYICMKHLNKNTLRNKHWLVYLFKL